MKTLFRVLGAAAAVAVTSVAIVALDKVLNDKGSLHVEEVEFPEDAEKDPEEAAKTAEAYAYAEGEAKAEHTPTEPGAAWPPAFAKEDGRPPEPEAPEAAPAVEAAKAEKAEATAEPEAAEEKPAADEVSVNPVEAGPVVAPKDENGKFDPTKIADASDFGDWEEQGCKG